MMRRVMTLAAARALPRPPWPGARPQYARCGAPICAGEVRIGLRFLCAGESEGSAIPAKGKLYVSGWSNSGALGLGEGVTRAEVPTEVPTEGPVVSVAAAKKFTVFATVYMCFALCLLMLVAHVNVCMITRRTRARCLPWATTAMVSSAQRLPRACSPRPSRSRGCMASKLCRSLRASITC